MHVGYRGDRLLILTVYIGVMTAMCIKLNPINLVSISRLHQKILLKIKL